MRLVVFLVLLIFLPAAAFAYSVNISSQLVGEQPSSFQEASGLVSSFRAIELPLSRFEPQGEDSNFASAGEGSTFGLKNMDEEVRLRTETTLASLGAKREGEHIIVTLSGDVLFDFDKADIRADAAPVLAQMVEVLATMSEASLTIIGHTDGKGADEYNQTLSERRAAAAKAWLINAGVTLPIMTQGKGKRQPVAKNSHADGSDNPAGRQKNRRVEFIIADS